jgi:hypothetical protein
MTRLAPALALLTCTLAPAASAQPASATTAATVTGFTVVPSPKLSGGELESVSATGPNDTWAVGYYDGGGNVDQTAVAEHWNGKSWTLTKLPDIQNGELLGVDAVSPTLAFAVGTSDSYLHSIALMWNGTTWTLCRLRRRSA